ncbi:hypothetical protein TJA_13350 [Thermus sp. LT1-2-5]
MGGQHPPKGQGAEEPGGAAPRRAALFPGEEEVALGQKEEDPFPGLPRPQEGGL